MVGVSRYPTARLLRFFFFGGACLLTASIFIAHTILAQELMQEVIMRTADQAVFFRQLIDANPKILQDKGLIYVARHHSIRLTHIDADGAVLQDSAFEPDTKVDLQSKADRIEFLKAKQDKVGSAARFSATLQQEMIYVVTELYDGTYLRVGVPYHDVQGSLYNNVTLLFALVILGAGVSALLYHIHARQLQKDLRQLTRGVEAVASGNYDHTIALLGRKEFEPLGNAIGILARDIKNSIQTITDKKYQLETILESLQEGVLVLDKQGNIQSFNHGFARLFPLVQQGMGKQIDQIVLMPALVTAVNKMLITQRQTVKTMRLEGEDKKQLLVHICPSSHNIPSIGIIVIIHDISGLLYVEQVHKNFVANVSHELRTPLTAINGYAETLATAKCSLADCKDFGGKILKNGGYLAKIIEDLLALARVDDDAAHIEKEAVSPLVCLRMAQQQVLVPENNEIVVTGEENPCVVYANAVLLAQAMRNLLANALRYAPPHSKVMVSLEHRDDMVIIGVSDDGIGIAPEEQKRVFERFYRVEKSRHSKTTGLGLAIVKQIVERFEGNIWVESPSPVANTTFYIALPCLKECSI